MSRTTTPILKAVLSVLHAVRVHRIPGRSRAHAGVIFMLHRVTPEPPPAFSPNRILNVTPEFLETTIHETRAAGFEFVSMDEVHRRLRDGDHGKPFATMTFDDGYKDNATCALPILKRYDVPATIYVPSAYPGGGADLWWLVLEEAIRRLDRVQLEFEGQTIDLPARETNEKVKAFHAVYWVLRTADERLARAAVTGLAANAGYDPGVLARELPMTWDELRAINQEPLITIGAHTVNHFAVAKLSAEEARAEMQDGAQRLEEELQSPVTHLSFPYGDPDSAGPRDFEIARTLGFKTAVTTQKGLVPSGAGAADCFALKRMSLNGDYQQAKYLRVLLSGVPFDLLDAAQKARATLKRAIAPKRRIGNGETPVSQEPAGTS
jgi:peptidoglycan/xylan/chitin deacetylase (PgdA/CDA1 family)